MDYDVHQVLQLYLCIGGVPFYLKEVKKGLSAIQNINQMCFQKGSLLRDEFNNLYRALFNHAQMHEAIIKFVASKRGGVSREEVESHLSVKGGTLTLWLKELEQAGFLLAFTPWGKKQRGMFYKVSDEYTLFYLTWIDPASSAQIGQELSAKYWEEIAQTPSLEKLGGICV